jgi:hypothetical protein
MSLINGSAYGSRDYAEGIGSLIDGEAAKMRAHFEESGLHNSRLYQD